MSPRDAPRLDLAPDEVAFCLDDAVRDPHGTLLGTVDRAVVTRDVQLVTHVGIQPPHHWQWPRLVAVELLRPAAAAPRGHVHVAAGRWPDGFPMADVLPGVPEDELPDHPSVSSGVASFLLSLTTSGTRSPLAGSASLRDRVPPGRAAVHADTHVVASHPRTLGNVGRVLGLVASEHGRVRDVLVQHRHGLRRRTARLPASRVERTGIGQVTTSASRRDLDRYDVPATSG